MHFGYYWDHSGQLWDRWALSASVGTLVDPDTTRREDDDYLCLKRVLFLSKLKARPTRTSEYGDSILNNMVSIRSHYRKFSCKDLVCP